MGEEDRAEGWSCLSLLSPSSQPWGTTPASSLPLWGSSLVQALRFESGAGLEGSLCTAAAHGFGLGYMGSPYSDGRGCMPGGGWSLDALAPPPGTSGDWEGEGQEGPYM